jgi:hypothetical protein
MSNCPWNFDGKAKSGRWRSSPSSICLNPMGSIKRGVDLDGVETMRITFQMTAGLRHIGSVARGDTPTRHPDERFPVLAGGSRLFHRLLGRFILLGTSGVGPQSPDLIVERRSRA